ncbi:hypothetical protein ES703_37362 [subsurface metagenome]
MKRLAGVASGIDAISEWTGKIVSKLILPIIGLMVCDVVMRYFFNAPLFWAHHTSLYMHATFSLLAAGYCLRHRAHVRVDIIYRRFSRRKQAILDVITAGLFFLFIVILLREGYLGFVESWRLQETGIAAWRVALWPVKLVVPLAAALLLLQGLAKFSRDFFYAVSGRELS